MRQQQLKFGLEGKSQLHLGAMVREAWLRSRQPSPWFALLTLLWLMIIYGCVDQLPALLVVRGMTDNQAQALAALLATIISAPVSATLDVMGLKIALGQRIDGGELRQCVVRSGRIIALALLFTLLVDLGLQRVRGEGLLLDSNGDPVLTLIVEDDRDVLQGAMEGAIWTFVGMLLISLACILMALARLRAIVLGPVSELVKALQKFGEKQDVSVLPVIDSSQEMALLSRKFREMAARISLHHSALLVKAQVGRALGVGEVGAGQVGAAAQQFGQGGGEVLQCDLAGLAAGHGFGLGMRGHGGVHRGLGKVARQLALHAAGEFGGQLGEGSLVGGEALVPGLFGDLAPGLGVPGGVHVGRHLERGMVPAQGFAGQKRLVRGDDHIGERQQAREHVVAVQVAAQLCGHGFEQAVSQRQTTGFVDVLEAVDIEQQHASKVLRPRELLQGVGQRALELGPVGQAGQGVVRSQLLDAGFGPADFAQIGVHVHIGADTLAVVLDAEGLAHCVSCQTPDGQQAAIEDWQRYGTNPVELLSIWERRQIELLLGLDS